MGAAGRCLGPEQKFVFIDLGRVHWQSAGTAMAFEVVNSLFAVAHNAEWPLRCNSLTGATPRTAGTSTCHLSGPPALGVRVDQAQSPN